MIRAAVKRLVRTTYAFSCGYCGVSETEVGVELTYDHFLPQAKGGEGVSDDGACTGKYVIAQKESSDDGANETV